MKKLNEMNKREKKEFLSMDLIERLIRLEQRVSASFGEFIRYSDTEYFKSLPEKRKKDFVIYLNKNKRRKYVIGFFFFSIIIIGILFFRGVITARAIENDLSVPLNIFDGILLIIVFIIIVIWSLSFLFNKKRERKIKGHFNIIEKLYPEIKKISF